MDADRPRCPAELAAVWVWHYHSQKRAYHDVIVQVSNDPEFASGVTTLFNNDFDNSAQLGKGNDKPYVESRFGKLVDAKGTKAQSRSPLQQRQHLQRHEPLY